MTRNRIVKRIQISYTEDIQLIANSLAVDNGYNSLTPEQIVDVEDQEDLLEGLTLQIVLVCELAKAAGADPEKVIQRGRSLELLTLEEQIQKKAEQNPQELTLREVMVLDEIPQGVEDRIWDSMKEVMEELDEADYIEGSSRVEDADAFNREDGDG